MLLKAIIPILSLAGLIFARPIDPEPVPEPVYANGGDRVVAFFHDISKHLHDIVDATKAFNGDVLDATAILDKYEGLLDTMSKAAVDLRAYPQIAAKDAVQTLEPSARIIEDVESVVKAIMAKKKLFDAAGLSPVVADTFGKGIEKANETFKVVTIKLPDNMLRVGQSILKRVLGYLNKGKKTFAG